MPSSIAHAAVAVIASPTLHSADRGRAAIWLAAAAAVAPDLDTVGWVFRGGHGPLSSGHRGITHSLAIAFAAAAIVTIAWRWGRERSSTHRAFAYFALVIASHGLLDSLSTYGSGIALLAPFSSQRFRAPWPLFDGLGSEMLLLWLPAFVFIRLNVGGFRARRTASGAVDVTHLDPRGNEC